jgi:Na+/proline symporter
MIGLMALMTGMEPIDGDMNNLIPQMVSMYLSPVFIGLFFILVIGSLSSTADSDLSAMSAIVMADVYGKNIAKNKPDPTKMLFIGRLTMIVATLIGVILASFSMDILIMLVFVGALWGAIVFPVIASCFWNRVTNMAFTSAVVAGLLMFCIARFELLPMVSAVAVLFELLAAVGGGVVLGLMAFGFCGRRVGLIVAAISAIGLAVLCVGFLRDYTVLLASLMAYGVSTIVCVVISLLSSSEFDFSQIDQKVINYDPAKPVAEA